MAFSGDIGAAKKSQRAGVLRRRQAIPATERSRASSQVADRAHAAIEAACGPEATIAAFQSFGDELDTRLLLARLDAHDRGLALPVVVRRGEPLVFRRWRPGDSMAAGPYGIEEPLPAAEAVEPDMLLVPLVAFDRDGFRLGYGGGFYDRSLARLRAMKPVVAIGLAFDEQEVEAVVRGPLDAALDVILTPTRRLDFTAGSGSGTEARCAFFS